MNTKSAFLQGNKIDREVYLKPPPEAGTSKLWKLNISVYGLCHALRFWHLSLKSVLFSSEVGSSSEVSEVEINSERKLEKHA